MRIQSKHSRDCMRSLRAAQARGSIWVSWRPRFRLRGRIMILMGPIRSIQPLRIEVPQKYRVWAILNQRRIQGGWTRGSLKYLMRDRCQDRTQVYWRSRVRICRRLDHSRGVGSAYSAAETEIEIKAADIMAKEVDWPQRVQVEVLWSASRSPTVAWSRSRWFLALRKRRELTEDQRLWMKKKPSSLEKRISSKHSPWQKIQKPILMQIWIKKRPSRCKSTGCSCYTVSWTQQRPKTRESKIDPWSWRSSNMLSLRRRRPTIAFELRKSSSIDIRTASRKVLRSLISERSWMIKQAIWKIFKVHQIKAPARIRAQGTTRTIMTRTKPASRTTTPSIQHRIQMQQPQAANPNEA